MSISYSRSKLSLMLRISKFSLKCNDTVISNALMRSTKIRAAAEYLPEDSLKLRKAFYCKENTGYLNKKVSAMNPFAMMNPDMMGNMMK